MNPTVQLVERRRWRLRVVTRRIGIYLLFALVWLGALACVTPLVIVLKDSVFSPSRGPFHRPALLSYLYVLQNPQLWVAFKNTAIEEAIILSTTLFFCPLAGYAFAKFAFRGKSALFAVMTLTLFFAPITQLIPLLLEMSAIGWVGTYQALVMPLAISSLGIFWMTVIIRGVPDEVLHAARLDGCGNFSTWWRIVMPTIRPALLALAFMTFLTAYDDYVWPLLILPQDSMMTIQIFLQAGSGFGYGGGGSSLATIVVASLPTVIAFAVMQHFFIPELIRRGDARVPRVEDEQWYLAAPSAPPAAAAIPPAERGPATEVRSTEHAEAPGIARPSALLAMAGLGAWPGSAASALIARCSIIVVASLAVYVNALQNNLRLDDLYRVAGNPGIETLMPFWRHFGDPFTSASIPSLAQYRPLLPLSLAVNHAISGDSLVGYRLGNLLITAAVGIVVYLLTRELLGRWIAQPSAATRVEFLALAVALLVTVHPVAGLLVNYISGRSLLLMELFLCSSLLVYARLTHPGRERSPRGRSPAVRQVEQWIYRWFGGSAAGWLAVLTLFELALLSKAQAIVAPAIILTFELTLGRGSLTRVATYARTLPFVLVAWAHMAYIDNCLHFSATPDGPNIGGDALWNYPLTQVRLSATHYLANFAWPLNLRQIPVEPTLTSMQDPEFLLGVVVIAGSLIAARLLRRGNPLAAFCIVVYWIVQSPESSITPMLHNAVDYRPYPASPFLFLLVALVLERRLKPPAATAVLVALIVYFSAVSLHMNTIW